jgi:dodecin
MSDATYKTVDIVASSTDGIEDAISGTIGKASESIHNLAWFEVGRSEPTSVTAR